MSSLKTRQLDRRTSGTSSDRPKHMTSRNASFPSAFPPPNREMTGLNKIIKADRGSKGRAVVAVVRPEDLPDLDSQCRPSRLKFWQNNDLVRTTTPDDLQDAIDDLQGDRRCQHLTLLISREVDDLALHVGGGINTLSIFRANHRDHPDGRLLISGSSTFRSIRLDEWQARDQNRNAIYLGEGVGIQVGLTEGTQWGNYSNALSDLEKTEIYQQFKKMHIDDNPNAGEYWWVKWQGAIAIILGLITGNKDMGSSFKATADGVYVGYQFGSAALKVVAAGISTSSMISAAGPATIMGVGAVAAVYFIPWNCLFEWLGGVLAKLYNKVMAMWRTLVEFLTKKMLSGSASGRPVKQKPMLRVMTL